MPDAPDPPAPASSSHLVAALSALTLAVLGLVGLRAGVTAYVRTRIDRLAPIELRQKNFGVLIQRIMADAPGVMPIYGSSELARPSAFRAGEFFARRPTGFQVSPVGERGTPLLVTAQQLAALGPVLAGRKVVIVVDLMDHTVFLPPRRSRQLAAYAGNWSSLQAGRAIHNEHLSPALRRQLAQRMRDFPEVLGEHPVLDFTLARLTGGTPIDRLGYTLARPFGALELFTLSGLDAGHVLVDLTRRPGLRRPLPENPEVLDWAELTDSAESMYAPEAGNNPAGMQQHYWVPNQKFYDRRRAQMTEAETVDGMLRSPDWANLDLVLQILREDSADVLLLSVPMPGQFLRYLGLSDALPRTYYDSLAAHATRAGARIATFDSLTYTPNILKDTVHPTPLGWVHFDQIIDAFYHDRLP